MFINGFSSVEIVDWIKCWKMEQDRIFILSARTPGSQQSFRSTHERRGLQHFLTASLTAQQPGRYYYDSTLWTGQLGLESSSFSPTRAHSWQENGCTLGSRAPWYWTHCDVAFLISQFLNLWKIKSTYDTILYALRNKKIVKKLNLKMYPLSS